jgi:hypothetical protein
MHERRSNLLVCTCLPLPVHNISKIKKAQLWNSYSKQSRWTCGSQSGSDEAYCRLEYDAVQSVFINLLTFGRIYCFCLQVRSTHTAVPKLPPDDAASIKNWHQRTSTAQNSVQHQATRNTAVPSDA